MGNKDLSNYFNNMIHGSIDKERVEKAIKEEHASWKKAIDKGYSEGDETTVERARGAMFALEGLAERLNLKYD